MAVDDYFENSRIVLRRRLDAMQPAERAVEISRLRQWLDELEPPREPSAVEARRPRHTQHHRSPAAGPGEGSDTGEIVGTVSSQ